MNQDQMEAFHLREVPDPAGMGTTQYVNAGGNQQVNEMDVASQGMTNSLRYMQSNGPTYPIQLKRNLRQPTTMTQAQLEEQKMNESQGLPSNIDEASRVVALEGKIETMEGGINAILQHLQGGQPPTPQARPAVVPPVRTSLLPVPPPVPVPRLIPVPVPPDPEMARLTTQPVSPVSTPDFFPHLSTPTETESDRIERIVQERLAEARAKSDEQDQIQLTEERPYGVDRDPIQLTEEALSPDEISVSVVEEPLVVDQAEQLKLQRQETLVSQTTQWIQVKDPLKFFKRFVGTTCNKNLSFNTWPATTQAAFTERFDAMVRDPSFISTLCGRILNMENGHLVAPHVAGAFITVIAGFLSFAMTEV